MPKKPPKWYHKLVGTVEQRRNLRDVWLQRLGLVRSHTPMELVRRGDLVLPNLVRSLAAEILLENQTLTFVQVGAFDGSSDDDLTSLLSLGKVEGVLVEPQPAAFAQLEQRFGGTPNLHLANYAIAPESGRQDFYSTRSGPSRLASFNRQNLLVHGVAEEEITCEPIPCLPLDQLLDDLGIKKLDVLQIDAEGYDLTVLSTLDLDRWQPSIIRFEYLHLPAKEVDECIAKLADRGYQFLVQERDLVACRPASPSVKLNESNAA